MGFLHAVFFASSVLRCLAAQWDSAPQGSAGKALFSLTPCGIPNIISKYCFMLLFKFFLLRKDAKTKGTKNKTRRPVMICGAFFVSSLF